MAGSFVQERDFFYLFISSHDLYEACSKRDTVRCWAWMQDMNLMLLMFIQFLTPYVQLDFALHMIVHNCFLFTSGNLKLSYSDI